MFAVVNEALFRQNLTVKQLCEEANLNYNTMLPKINGRKTPHSTGDITFPQAVAIKRALGIDLPLEVIFAEAISEEG